MTSTRAQILILSLVLAVGASAFAPAPTVRAADQSFTLIGHFANGWGSTVATIGDPGPTLSVAQGDRITLTLNATDTQPHTWFIDYDNDNQADTGENVSAQFQGNTPITHTFIVTRAGSYTYRCSIHPADMKGPITIQGPAAPPSDNTLLIVGGIVVVVAIVAAAAGMMMRKRAKPPTQPPTQ